MPIKSDREYRSMNIDMRKADENSELDFMVRGYASTFDEYKLFEMDGVDYCERIEPSAFDEADMSDVIFLYNHEGMVYARQKNGTLTITRDEHGLHTEANLGLTEASRGLYESIKTGLIDQMSFAFTVSDDDWERSKCKSTRIIKRIGKVYDVSAVSIPANSGTDISAVSARSAFHGEMEMRKAERLARQEQLDKAKAEFFSIGE